MDRKTEYQRVRRQESNDERNWMYEKKYFSIATGMEEEVENSEREDKEDSSEDATPRMKPINGLCAVCHLAVDITSSDHNENIPCSKGHALCRLCAKHFSVRSGAGCAICRTQFEQPNPNFSRGSNLSLNSGYMDTTHKGGQEYSLQQPYHRNHHRSVQEHVPLNTKESFVRPWIQNQQESYNIENVEIQDSYYGEIREQTNVQEEDDRKERNRQQRQQSCCSLMKRENPNPYPSEVKLNGQITQECSRRPIRCPRIDCAINVAFSALTHHFIFDHPEVPILSVDPGTQSTIIVSFGALPAESSRCLALLLVSGKLSDPAARLFNGNQINPKYRNRLPLPVLAARLHSTNRYISSNEKLNNDEEDRRQKDLIIAWVAGLEIGSTTGRLRCSIQAVDNIGNEGLRSLTYTGPVNSLRTAQRPRDIFSAGDCIVLHEGLLGHITSDCANLNVNVIVH